MQLLSHLFLHFLDAFRGHALDTFCETGGGGGDRVDRAGLGGAGLGGCGVAGVLEDAGAGCEDAVVAFLDLGGWGGREVGGGRSAMTVRLSRECLTFSVALEAPSLISLPISSVVPLSKPRAEARPAAKLPGAGSGTCGRRIESSMLAASSSPPVPGSGTPTGTSGFLFLFLFPVSLIVLYCFGFGGVLRGRCLDLAKVRGVCF